MKKILSIVLCMVMLVATLGAIPASAEIRFVDHNSFYEEENDDYLYKVIDGVYYKFYIDDCDNEIYDAYVIAILPPEGTKKVEILDEVYCYGNMVEIDEIRFQNYNIFSNYRSSIEEIVIGDIDRITGINFIPSLKKVVLGEGVKTIENCFYGCKNLETIEGNPNFMVEDGAIYKQFGDEKRLVSILDNKIKSFNIKEGVTSFDSPFGTYGNISVKSLNVNGNLDVLMPGKIKKLNTITFGENVTKIKKIDLNGVRNLKTLDLSNIDVNTFYAKGVWHMKSVSFGKIKKLLKHSFRGCKKIETIEFKENVPKIYKDAFKNKKAGIKFYVNSKENAKSLKKQLKKSGAKNPEIYIGEKLYK